MATLVEVSEPAVARPPRFAYLEWSPVIAGALGAAALSLLFLTFGLVLTGHAILTPQLMVILMLTGDLLAMSSSTD